MVAAYGMEEKFAGLFGPVLVHSSQAVENRAQVQGSQGGWAKGSRVLGVCVLAGDAWPRVHGVEGGRAMGNNLPGCRQAEAGGQILKAVRESEGRPGVFEPGRPQ